MENKILNKSLEELLKDSNLETKVEILEKKGSVIKLDSSLIVPNPYQPRTNFDSEALDDLAKSIKQYGIFNPIIVRKVDDKYQIVAGERRFRASKIANLKEVPVIVNDFSDQEMSEIALIENMQREDLSPLEISKGLNKYQKDFNLTQQELAKRMGKSRSYIANILRLIKLPKSIQKELEDKSLSVGHVRTLIGLDEDDAIKYLKKIKEDNLNVRETEDLISSIKQNKDKKDKEDKECVLKDTLKTNVKVTKNEIKISYNSKEELEKILKEIIKK